MSHFELKYEEWLEANMNSENNHKRRELLSKGLGHGTVEFLRSVWFPAVGHFDHLPYNLPLNKSNISNLTAFHKSYVLINLVRIRIL
ncbi:hypothetical protein J2Z66_002579 [Paenibacillus eucommiae]|uniref:Uncharacterized protein n=1 Tax=Paenibacillus eucommiae TaxID=1355755 RepID=A0ABS4ITR7_9BACL|nr:hypothetical protein [Paenibacillus eucommiae]